MKGLAEEFIQDKNARGFFIGGQSGSGKTHICTAICREYLKKGREIRYINFIDFMSELKGDFIKAEETINDIQRVEVLYIDDLFKKTATQFDIETVYRIIDYRLRNGLITIFSSEKKLVNDSSVNERAVQDIISIDFAVARRIIEMVGKYKVSIPNDVKYF